MKPTGAGGDVGGVVDWHAPYGSLSAKKVERAIALSVEKYCPASAMMGKTAVVTHDFEVVDTGEAHLV